MADYLALSIGRFLVFLLVALPDRLAFRLARFYVTLIFLVKRDLEKVALKNLELVFPDKSAAERQEIFRKSQDVLAENILGYARIPMLTEEQAKAMCEYDHATKEMDRLRSMGDGIGVLIPTIHFDAFEYFIQVHAINYRPVSVLARRFNLPRFDAWWRGRREQYGNIIFDRAGGFKEITRRLKLGEDVVVMCDQNVKRNHAIFVEFFGIPAATAKTVAITALRTGARILFGSPVQTVPGKFEVTAVEIPHPSEEEGTTDEKIAKCTAHMHRAFEEQILRRPEAWFWIHRRWKTRPEGEPENFYA